ncbi:MAG: protein-disulfide reductase DsbD [Janthinobacterium lividum]
MSEHRFARAGLWFALLFLALCCGSGRVRADSEFLDPKVAFAFSASEVPGAVVVRFAVADGYYMYRERLSFVPSKGGDAVLGVPALPVGEKKFDETFGKEVEVYRHILTVRIPVQQAAHPFDLLVGSQGCADKGVCYPPMTNVFRVGGAALTTVSTSTSTSSGAAGVSSGSRDGSSYDAGAMSVGNGAGDAASTFGSPTDILYDQDFAERALAGHGLAAIAGIFFLLGIAMSLLPCSLPMIPILSSVILGEGEQLTRRRGLLLSLAYVLGMAVVYTLFGVAAALAGYSLGAALQNPWMLGAFAVLLTAFALSLLGCYTLQLPSAWQNRVDRVSQRQRRGRVLAVFVMGALSAVVVGACMTAPLFGVLAFIARTGDVVLGALALFAMALGLGVPLVVVGVGAGSLLPRAGAWMDGVKRLFGLLLIAVAVWIVAPVLPIAVTLILAALALMAAAMQLGAFGGWSGATEAQSGTWSISESRRAWRMIGRALGLVLATWSVICVVGAAMGARDFWHPLASSAQISAQATGGVSGDASPLAFATVRSSSELDRSLAGSGKPSLLFFHADWCVSCREMEKFVFTDPAVMRGMSSFGLIKADVTANDADDQALMQRFGLFGPPAVIFFDAQGKELKSQRIVGYQPAARFEKSLAAAQTAAARASHAKTDAPWPANHIGGGGTGKLNGLSD